MREPEPSIVPTAKVEEPAPEPVPTHSFAIPALEIAASELVLMAFNNAAFPEPWALVSWDRIRSNLDGTSPWEFDVDFFEVNQFGHPYQGAIYFTAARSSGLSFWISALYTFAGSLLWEVTMENEAPSINDQITTTLGGIFLGEALHRAYRALMDEKHGPVAFTRRLTATVLSPLNAVNHWLYGREVGEVRAPSLLEGSFNVGLSLLGRYGTSSEGVTLQQPAQLFLAGELAYGTWGTSVRPFSFFHVEGAVTAPGTITAQLYIRGVLAGVQWDAPWGRGVAGAYGVYDFAANNILRVSSVGAGPGIGAELKLGKEARFRGTLVLAGIGFGAAGTVDDAGEGERDYRIGPGGQAIIDLQLARLGLGSISLRARYWQLTRFYVELTPGLESILYVTAALSAQIGPRLAVGLQIPVYLRNFGIGPQADVAFGSGPRLVVTILSEEGLGP